MSVAMTKPGKPSLESFHIELHAILDDVHDLCANLTPEQLATQPPTGGWSVQECLVHLNLTGELYCEQLEPVIDAAKASGERGRGPFRYGLLGGLFIRSQEPPVRYRMTSPKSFRPVPVPDNSALPTFLSLQERLQDLMHRAEGLPLNKLKITSPESKWLRMSVLEAFGLLLVHERRHLWQAREVKDTLRA